MKKFNKNNMKYAALGGGFFIIWIDTYGCTNC